MLACQRNLFQLDESVAFLNGAYMSPQLKAVEAAGKHALVRKNKPNRIFSEDFFTTTKSVKVLYNQLINGEDPDRVALIPSVSYGVATVAKNLPFEKGQKIIVAKDQFPSNYYSWESLANKKEGHVELVGVSDGADKALRWNAAILDAIDERTAAVALSHVHWAEGTLYDLEAIRAKTREVGAWLVIDGTQSVGALPFDQKKIQADALICAAYKWLMGPYSTAVAYFGPALDKGHPIEENWINRKDSQDFRNLVNYQNDYQPLAGRYCVGEQSNFLLLPMLEAALQQIIAWQPERIQEYCEHLNAPFLDRLIEMGFKIAPSSQRGHHLIGIQLPDHLSLEEVQEALKQANVLVSMRGNSVRVSPNVYNHGHDWQRLCDAMHSVAMIKA